MSQRKTGNPPAPDQFTSVDQFLDTPEFRAVLENEFPEDAAEWLDPVSRRKFVGLMGASLALAGVAGCNPSLKPASGKKNLPYVKKPEGLLPGVPLFFPTVFTLGGTATGVIVKSVEGRPVKIEGNPAHPASLGGCDTLAQCSILGFYDPDRSKEVKNKGVPTTWDKAKSALAKIVADARPAKGAGLRILSEYVCSPTLIALLGELKTQLPAMEWLQYEPLSHDNALKGSRLAFGKYVTPVYKFADANVVVSLDSDFLSSGAGSLKYAREAMSRRKVRVSKARKAGDGVAPDKLSRIYAIESAPTTVAGVADHRVPLKPSEVESFVRLLAKELGVDAPAAGPLPEYAAKLVKPIADDVKAAAGAAVLVPGATLSPAAHALIHAVHAKIGAAGKTVSYLEAVGVTDALADSVGGLAKLVADAKAGKVETLVVLGANPAFTAPADLGFVDAFKTIKTTVHLGAYEDETGTLAGWHINEAHYLETWGDARAFDGTAAIQQPLIAPMAGGKSAVELLAAMLDRPTGSPMLVVQDTWKKWFADAKKTGDFDLFWQAALEKGVIDGTAAAPVAVGDVKLADEVKAAPAPATKAGEIEIAFRADPTIYDGRYANNGWLQELPKPITKLTWDNAAIVSPATAERLKIENEFSFTGGEHGNTVANKVDLKVGERTLKAAAFILPGHADDVITLHLGYGRERTGKVSVGTGFNAYALRTTAGFWAAAGVTATKVAEKYTLACTQGQHAMEGRRPARHGTKEAVKASRHPVKHDDHEHLEYPPAFDFADNPPAAAAEKSLMRPLLPGSPEERRRLHETLDANDKPWLPHGDHPGADEHDGHGHHGHEHDKRLTPLTLIADKKVNKTYRRWAMAIDLGACSGCTACVAACVAENNIPVVGKDQVTRGRAMHWIRIDRYFSVPAEAGGTEKMTAGARAKALIENTAAVQMHPMPVPCQQCEKAPCEVVCPVGATVHSADGLNDMAYNRCVGTRYCSNNCPYKVRRFNFLQYADYASDSTLKLVNNPDVTVRTRGVMEKCTYCVQRIRNAEIEAEREHDSTARPQAKMPDGSMRPLIFENEVVTACQAACPAGAIAFGDLNQDQYDVNGGRLDMSEVARWKFEPSHYGLLAELNTMPRTGYLAAVKNPNPAIVPTAPAAEKGGH